MDTQTIINLTGGVALATVGWFARELWGAVKQLQRDVHDLEIDLPSHYVSKEEYMAALKEIRDLCGKIFDKIDALDQRKADK